ncbi:hypothetical protein QZH41_000471 [Actinostola sp. cb2023]|nr:hypothetical protein QZH41_000471 [Actinostola sp. cb2023]
MLYMLPRDDPVPLAKEDSHYGDAQEGKVSSGQRPKSRADFAKVPTRQRFADIVVNAFEQSVDVARVSHWVVSQEDHQQNSDDDGRSGKHYHMAVKLTKRARWARVRGYLESSHEIRVNFSANHNTYYSAYQYVTKDDKDFVLSNAHPELRDPPTTENAIAARKAQRRGKKGKRKRSERYSTFDVVEVIQHHNITTRLELVCLAMKQKDAGKTTLAEFIANRGSKVIDEALFLAKEFKEAPANDNAKFELGERTRRKANPDQVALEMRNARNEQNERLFEREEWLSKTQIAGFFSRLAARGQKSSGQEAAIEPETDDDRADIEAEIRESDRCDLIHEINEQIGLKHPIIYDTYDLCDYYRKEKINAFNVAMLKTILSNFEVPYRAKDRKAELVRLLCGVIMECQFCL